MNKYQRTILCGATVGGLLMPGWDAAAAELGNFCWMTESQQLLRFSVNELAPGRFNYTGIFADTDGAKFAIIGHLEIEGGALIGSFSGSKTTSDSFKTAIYRVTFDGNLVGFGEGIRHKYDRFTANTSSEYRTHTLTPISCPPHDG